MHIRSNWEEMGATCDHACMHGSMHPVSKLVQRPSTPDCQHDAVIVTPGAFIASVPPLPADFH